MDHSLSMMGVGGGGKASPLHKEVRGGGLQ